ncbi:MAG: flagellar filament capping protein FliD [Pseudomonadota bacterium]
MVAATGIGSGLDIESLVTQLVAAERAPTETRLLQREARLTSEISAFGTLQGALSSLQASAQSLANASTFSQRLVTSSNSAAVSPSVAGDDTPLGSLSVSVSSLAQAQSLASTAFSSTSDVVGEGVLNFRFGTVTATPPTGTPQSFDAFSENSEQPGASVTIDASNNTLAGVRDAINDADIGISAALVDDGTGFRLLLSSEQTGENNAIELQVSDTGDNDNTDSSGLSRFAFNTAANNLQQTVAGQDAQFTIAGLEVSSASNSVSNVIDGLDLTLLATTTSPVTLTTSENTQAVRTAIEDFVNGFNNFTGVVNSLTAFDPATSSAGPLQGDFTARSIINQVRGAVTDAVDGATGAFSTLAELGIQTQSDGTLSIDDAVLDAALQSNFDDIASVFAQVATASGSVSVNSFPNLAEDASFAIEVTQFATQGELLGAVINEPSSSSPAVIDADNDTFTITVDGTTSDTITLTQGSFATGAALAAEIQTQIDADDALNQAGVGVAVSFTSDFQIRISSQSTGSASSIAITSVDSTSSSTLGLSVASGTDGEDLQGTIDGVAATVQGQVLTAAVGSAAEGLSVSVSGTTLGLQGTVAVSNGLAVGLNGVLENFLNSQGLIELRTDGLQSSVDRVGEDREALETRLQALEARLRSQFNALDTLLASLQTTSDFLTQQLANIPIPGADSSNN